MFERLAKADKLGCEKSGVGTAETHDAYSAAAGRRRDGGDGVDDGRRDFRDGWLVLGHTASGHAASIVGNGASESVRFRGHGGGRSEAG